MVCFKEYKQRDKVYLSIIENGDMKAELGTTFIAYPSLLCPEVEKMSTVLWSNFASFLTTKVVDRAHDDMYFFAQH